MAMISYKKVTKKIYILRTIFNIINKKMEVKNEQRR